MNETRAVIKIHRMTLNQVPLDMFWYWLDREWHSSFLFGKYPIEQETSSVHPECGLPGWEAPKQMYAWYPGNRNGALQAYKWKQWRNTAYEIVWHLESLIDGSEGGRLVAWQRRSDQLEVGAWESIPGVFVGRLFHELWQCYGDALIVKPVITKGEIGRATGVANDEVVPSGIWRERLRLLEGWPAAKAKSMNQFNYARDVCQLPGENADREFRRWKEVLIARYGCKFDW